jgi:hypothetical protein
MGFYSAWVFPWPGSKTAGPPMPNAMACHLLRFGSLPLSCSRMSDALRRVFVALVIFAFLGGTLGHAVSIPCQTGDDTHTMASHIGHEHHPEQVPSKNHDAVCSLFCTSGFNFIAPDMTVDIPLQTSPTSFSAIAETFVGHSAIPDPGIPKHIV